jgi:pyruvate formate lyase activating enzyme
LDYPNTISAIIWTIGCNFKCPFCYNPNLVNGTIDVITEDEIFSFLKKRKNVLEGLSISGGEPLLQPDIVEFIGKVKNLGYLVKVDTNGSYPEKLQELTDKKLIDYISMDVKAPKIKYNKITGLKIDTTIIEKSIQIIKKSSIDYEFKTTFVPDLLKKEDIIAIAQWLKGSRTYFLQQFKADTPLISSETQKKCPYSKEYIIETHTAIQSYFTNCDIRGL